MSTSSSHTATQADATAPSPNELGTAPRRRVTSIAVGIDGSHQARQALQWAAHWADHEGATLTLLTAVGSTPQSEAAAQEHLASEVAGVTTRHPDLDVTAIVSTRTAHPALVEVSDDVDVLVMGARGIGGWNGLTLGGVATRVAAHAHCPVIVVPAGVSQGRTNLPVVFGYDGSRNAESAAHFALDQAAVWGLTGLAVLVRADHGSERIQVAPEDLTKAEGQQGREVAQIGEQHPDSKLIVRHLRADPAGALISLMPAASMLVVGRSGSGAATLMGSTVRALLQGARCPIVVVPTRRSTR